MQALPQRDRHFLPTHMLDLSMITLCALTNKNIPEHEEAFRKSSEGIQWGAKKLIVDLDCTDINIWNRKIIYELHHYVQTPYAMLIHADGYPINPGAWRPEFLDYDYIGAPWPLPTDDYSYLTPAGKLVRVGNSVSIRSKRILELPGKLGLTWRSYYGNTNEDGFLCCHNKDILTANGCTFAPIEVAKFFSKEHTTEENKDIPPQEIFAFHQVDL